MSYYLSKLESIKSLKELYVFREELLCDLAKNRTHELDTTKIEASQNINFYLEIVERQIKNEAIKRNYLTKIESPKTESNLEEKKKKMKQMESSNVIQKQTNGCLSAMQQFFLNIISQSNKELNPCYLASIYYESIGKRRHAASRDSFGQTSAAYRTCRKLVSLSLVKEIHYKTSSGYSYTMYTALI